ncbi:MAG: EpsI family protein [Thermodesulfobacteriota bacterium]|jgi:EpsI family protein|nr:EpsI family protein [Thermodesulfobacteriota bacterium]
MIARLVIVALILGIFGWYLQGHSFHERMPLQTPLQEFPRQMGGWQGRDYFFSEVILEQLRVSDYIMRVYRQDDDRGVSLYLGYYETQGEGAQIHSPRHCLPGGGWYRESEQVRTVRAGGRDIDVVQAVYRKDDSREVFIYWYQMKNAAITNDYMLKVQMVLNSLKYGRNDAAFVRLSAPVTSSVEEAVTRVEDFMEDFVPQLDRFLPE